jgi:hypothetical protein
MPKEDERKQKGRGAALRETIDRLLGRGPKETDPTGPDAAAPREPPSPRTFIGKRMAELDKKKDPPPD